MLNLRDQVLHHSKTLAGIDLGLLKDADYDADVDYFISICADNVTVHPDWGLLAGKISMLSLKMQSGNTFSETTQMCIKQLHPDYAHFVLNNANKLNSMIVDENNFNFDLMGLDSLRKSYLLKRKEKRVVNGKEQISLIITEEPEQLYLRVAVWLWFPNMEKIRRTYNSLAYRRYIHASPTLFNSGLKRPQLGSCFTKSVFDSMSSISKSWEDSAIISQNSGGIGLDLNSIRHSEIGETGKSRGIVPLILTYERIFNYVDQGGKRKGSCAIYLSPWHIDFMDFIEMKKKIGDEKLRAKDLFYAAWISDLFMERVENDKMWSFFCPNKAQGLSETYGLDFELLYHKYENEGKYEKQLPARVIMFEIIKAQTETGVPYILYKDAINRKSMQSNIGMIRLSNLCAEIVLHTSEKEISSCNLASICLNRFINGKVYDYTALGNAAYELTENMNQVIDRTYYPNEVPQIKYANLKNRPIGIGVQGLADTIAMLDLCWESDETKDLIKMIFETIYYNCIRSSVDQSIQLHRQYQLEYINELQNIENLLLVSTDSDFRAKLNDHKIKLQHSGPKKGWYPSFPGSPYSRGKFQFDLWLDERVAKSTPGQVDIEQINQLQKNTFITNRYDWEGLRKKMTQFGLRNSTLIALMPTATSAHINRNNECIEPFNNMMGMRTILSGQFTMVNHHMVKDFEKLGIWNKNISHEIIKLGGSIQLLDVPESIKQQPLKVARFKYLKRKYKTVYELPQKLMLDISAIRGPFVCQTTSQNCFFNRPTIQGVYSYHMHGWRLGLKTGMYYLRSNPVSNARNVVVQQEEECLVCQS